jgi:hypothetical protein
LDIIINILLLPSRLSFSDRKEGRNYLNALAHHPHIWKPDIYILKHGTYKGITPTEVALRIYPSGRIFYTFRRHLVLNCEGDLHIFPFDSPMCTFSLESISSPRANMEFHWVPGPDWGGGGPAASSIALSPVLKMHNAYLIYNETLLCDGEEWRGDFSCLKVRKTPVPEFVDQVFAKTSPKRSFSVIENDRFGLVFARTVSTV